MVSVEVHNARTTPVVVSSDVFSNVRAAAQSAGLLQPAVSFEAMRVVAMGPLCLAQDKQG